MTGYRDLLKKNPTYVGYGVLHYLFSSFGQTYLISLFVPKFIETLGINNTRFALIYSGATLTAAIFLPYLGSLVDKIRIRYISVANGLMLVLFCWIVSHTPNQIILFLGIVGLRLGGQGMMIIIGSTAISRYFTENRGKALSLSALGLPIGETILPPLLILLMHQVGWEFTWIIISLIILTVFIPSAIGLVRRDDNFQKPRRDDGINKRNTEYTRLQILKDPVFYIIMPTILFIPFFLTGIFIHQNLLGEMKGWSLEWLGACIAGYGTAKLITNLLGGPIIDKYTARKTFSFQLIPVGIGILVLFHFTHPIAYLIFLFTAGITTSFGSLTNAAIWAEMYGPRHLGTIKSIVTTLVIFSTALGAIIIEKLYLSDLSFQIGLIFLLSTILLNGVITYIILVLRLRS
ncbi:nitrate/nitrite transporter [Bacteroidota bacterium]